MPGGKLKLLIVVMSLIAVLGMPAVGQARARGRNVPRSSLRTEFLPRPSGRLHIVTLLREELDVQLYRPDGAYDEEALAGLDHLLRDRRNGKVRAMDPRLYEILSMIQDHFEGRRILATSGFRIERPTSRHYHGSAIDFNVEGISYQELFEFANTLDRGGMGMGRYPRKQFVHVDFRAPGEPSYRWSDRGRLKRHKGKKHHLDRTHSRKNAPVS